MAAGDMYAVVQYVIGTGLLFEEVARDEERRIRFQREATLLESRNHPNIAPIYGLEQSGGTHYLVLELVLARRWQSGSLVCAQ